MTNLHEPHFEIEGNQRGFRYRRARLGYQAGCERLGVSPWELPPGEATPYGYHYGNEELLIVLAGSPSMRTPDGWRGLREGDLVSFPVGDWGAHQFLNQTHAPIRLLMFSEMGGPEVTVYPDSKKIGVFETTMAPERGGFAGTFRIEDAVDCYEGERPPDVGTS
ncbi:MAG: cupin domain-containing protein [Thermoleophilaceae bacterium]